MPNNLPNDLSVMFRSHELQRRQTTAQNLMRILDNIERLSNEPLTEDEKAIHKLAVHRLQLWELELKTPWSSLSFWRKLWLVLTRKV